MAEHTDTCLTGVPERGYADDLRSLPVFSGGTRNTFSAETKQLFVDFIRRYQHEPHVRRDVTKKCNISKTALQSWVSMGR